MRTVLFKSLAALALLTGCGVSNYQETTSPRSTSINLSIDDFFIETTHENDPYKNVCSLHLNDGRIIGSGVLIRSNVVLTAAHCLENVDISYVTINGDIIDIECSLKHPDYSDSCYYITNDIGLMFLSKNSVETPAVIGDSKRMRKHQSITSVGYSFGYKKYSKPFVFSYFGILTNEPDSIKFIPRPVFVWFGDSGGGIFSRLGNKEVVIGIISSFTFIEIYNKKRIIGECSATSISYFIDWINEEVSINED